MPKNPRVARLDRQIWELIADLEAVRSDVSRRGRTREYKEALRLFASGYRVHSPCGYRYQVSVNEEPKGDWFIRRGKAVPEPTYWGAEFLPVIEKMSEALGIPFEDRFSSEVVRNLLNLTEESLLRDLRKLRPA